MDYKAIARRLARDPLYEPVPGGALRKSDILPLARRLLKGDAPGLAEDAARFFVESENWGMTKGWRLDKWKRAIVNYGNQHRALFEAENANGEKVARELVGIARLVTGRDVKWLWHISNSRFRKFSRKMAINGLTWFSKDKDDLLREMHGASIDTRKPVWLYKCSANVDKTAGWDEYEKYLIAQLRQMGYDSIDLDDDFVVMDVDKIKIHEVERVET